MAISADFGLYGGNPKALAKTVDWQLTNRPIQAFEEIDDLTCDFILDGADYHSYNYMKVDWGGTIKYYFIEKRTGMTGNRTKVRGTCDVLTTYKGVIMGAPAIINRTSWATDYTCDPMLRDNKVTTTSRTIVSTEQLTGPIIGDQEYFYVGVLQASPSIEFGT